MYSILLAFCQKSMTKTLKFSEIFPARAMGNSNRKKAKEDRCLYCGGPLPWPHVSGLRDCGCGALKIKIRLGGKETEIYLRSRSATTLDVKYAILRSQQIPYEHQHLRFRNVDMPDGQLLEEWGIHHESVPIEVTVVKGEAKLPPLGDLAKSVAGCQGCAQSPQDYSACCQVGVCEYHRSLLWNCLHCKKKFCVALGSCRCLGFMCKTCKQIVCVDCLRQGSQCVSCYEQVPRHMRF